MFAIKIEKSKAQEIIAKLKEEKNIDNNYKIKRDESSVILPVLKITPDIKIFETQEEKLEIQKQVKKGYKDILLEKGLDKDIVSKINSAYDIVGDIIVIGIDKEYTSYYPEIGEALLELHPNIKTVLNKIGEHKGIYRTQDMELVFGKDTRETIIKENGCRIKIDVEKVFCSTRLSEERRRIVDLVEPEETIGVFFAGAGPFALAIAKNKEVKEIIAIELNDLAVKYLIENIKLNHTEEKIKPILGNVKIEAKKYPNYFDRVIMPLPKSAELFLDSAIFSCKSGGYIHLYKFVSKDDPYTETEKEIEEIAKTNRVNLEIVGKRIIRSYSPSIVQIVVDLRVRK
ncbi:MAG TPA: class I SAM-dependent methyltransferase family protein [archaeon]|nr:class I SAM-dependent methyltransferase family protein [archaeon]